MSSVNYCVVSGKLVDVAAKPVPMADPSFFHRISHGRKHLRIDFDDLHDPEHAFCVRVDSFVTAGGKLHKGSSITNLSALPLSSRFIKVLTGDSKEPIVYIELNHNSAQRRLRLAKNTELRSLPETIIGKEKEMLRSKLPAEYTASQQDLLINTVCDLLCQDREHHHSFDTTLVIVNALRNLVPQNFLNENFAPLVKQLAIYLIWHGAAHPLDTAQMAVLLNFLNGHTQHIGKITDSNISMCLANLSTLRTNLSTLVTPYQAQVVINAVLERFFASPEMSQTDFTTAMQIVDNLIKVKELSFLSVEQHKALNECIGEELRGNYDKFPSVIESLRTVLSEPALFGEKEDLLNKFIKYSCSVVSSASEDSLSKLPQFFPALFRVAAQTPRYEEIFTNLSQAEKELFYATFKRVCDDGTILAQVLGNTPEEKYNYLIENLLSLFALLSLSDQTNAIYDFLVSSIRTKCKFVPVTA